MKKTLVAKVLKPRRDKWLLLKKEYDNFQRVLKGEDAPLYSATKQQAERLRRKINGKQSEYPLILRRDVIKVEKRNTVLTPFWFRFPIFGKRGGIWLPIALQEEIKECWSIRQGQLVRRGDDWYIHLVIEQDKEDKDCEYNDVIGIDLGVKNVATVVCLSDGKTKFYDKELRAIRGKYYHLRKKLGELKKKRAIRKIGSKERRLTKDRIHKISREIVDLAKERNAIIAIGDLKGINKNNFGRKGNRKKNSAPYYMLRQFIEYKAKEEEVLVLSVSERRTSKEHWKCGKVGRRKTQGLFVCKECKEEENADRNAGFNIALRALGQCSEVGATVAWLEEGDSLSEYTPQPQASCGCPLL